MKTTYKTPVVEIVYLEDNDMIATSNQVTNAGNDTGSGIAAGNERNNPIWD